MCLPVITSRNFSPATGKGMDCEPWNHLSVCVWDIHVSSSLWRGKLCLPACDASLQFSHSGLIPDFNEGFHMFRLHDTICDFLGGDYFIVTDTFWYTWTVFFLSSLINAVLCHCIDVSMPPQYLHVWYVISTVVRISVTCPFTAWHFFPHLHVEHVKTTSS
jgi:hypothetical protein